MGSRLIFSKEEKVIQLAEAILESDTGVNTEAYRELLKHYQKLTRQMTRMVTINDRQQAELNRLNERSRELADKLAKYLPHQIYNMIFSGKRNAEIHAERKKLTVFFSDIVNFTGATRHMEPEEMTALLNHYLNEMFEVAVKHGGTIDKTIGDAIMIFFGDPESKGVAEDALACAAMAIEMRERVVEMRDALFQLGVSNPFRIRMGMATGFCTVGNFGGERRLDYTIIGNPVNLASRLESKADPNQILVSHETYSLIKERICCRKKSMVKLKGIDGETHAYEVIDFHESVVGSHHVDSCFQGFSLRLDTNLVAEDRREEALNALRKALSELENQI